MNRQMSLTAPCESCCFAFRVGLLVASMLALALGVTIVGCATGPAAPADASPPSAALRDSSPAPSPASTSAAPQVLGTGSIYRVLPAASDDRSLAGPLVVRRFAASPSQGIVLTFDDGPDPIWTPALLDLLARERVPAAFFVVGRRAAQHPAIVQRAARDGHLIANHTTTHPHLTTLTPADLDTEVLATQRIIANILGAEPSLFRCPFSTNPALKDPALARALARVSQLGLTIVGADAGIEDYAPGGTPQMFVDQIFQQLGEPGPWIVVMHDGGGDRSRTIQAVRLLIPEARGRGYEFLSLREVVDSAMANPDASASPGTTLPSNQNPNHEAGTVRGSLSAS
jgi:peptidoglycan/xylan/chitin deacetylase (PgdA/CDA1 family)